MRTFRLVQHARANELFGEVRTVETSVLTEKDGGVHVDTHVVGTCEGTPVNYRSSRFAPGASMERAVAWRLANGYVEVV
jgi:hypothetical protein